nr:MAG TPA: hypothetical protein [Bacteriophage sp.]
MLLNYDATLEKGTRGHTLCCGLVNHRAKKNSLRPDVLPSIRRLQYIDERRVGTTSLCAGSIVRLHVKFAMQS